MICGGVPETRSNHANTHSLRPIAPQPGDNLSVVSPPARQQPIAAVANASSLLLSWFCQRSLRLSQWLGQWLRSHYLPAPEVPRLNDLVTLKLEDPLTLVEMTTNLAMCPNLKNLCIKLTCPATAAELRVLAQSLATLRQLEQLELHLLPTTQPIEPLAVKWRLHRHPHLQTLIFKMSGTKIIMDLSSLTGCHCLTTLDVTCDQFQLSPKACFPSGSWSRNLHRCCYHAPQLSFWQLKGLKKTRQLQHLDLSGCRALDQLPLDEYAGQNIEFLDISHTQIDKIEIWLNHLITLRCQGLDTLLQLPLIYFSSALQHINARQTQLEEGVLNELLQKMRLQTLFLSSMAQLDDNCQFDALQELFVDDGTFAKRNLSNLRQANSLKKITLRYPSGCVAFWPTAQFLQLGEFECQLSPNDTTPILNNVQFLRNCSQLRILKITDCDAAYCQLNMIDLSQLQHLHLSGSAFVTDDLACLNKGSQLQTLHLERTHITKLPSSLELGCLRILKIINNPQLNSDSALMPLVDARVLQELTIIGPEESQSVNGYRDFEPILRDLPKALIKFLTLAKVNLTTSAVHTLLSPNYNRTLTHVHFTAIAVPGYSNSRNFVADLRQSKPNNLEVVVDEQVA